MTLYHHLGMEARHFPTTFERPQDSETKQNPCGLMRAILGSKDRHIFYRRKSGVFKILQRTSKVFWACVDTVALYGKKHITWQPSPKHLMQLQLQVASVPDFFLNRDAQVRAWLSRALARHMPGPRCQALNTLPQRQSVYKHTQIQEPQTQAS